jgi:hypothetical protein
MAGNTIQLKRSTTAGEVPASLAAGELAVDIAEGKLYYGNSLGTVSGLIQEMYMTVSGAPPANPKDSALWFQTDTEKLFVYHSSTWYQTGGLSEELIGVNDTSGHTEIYCPDETGADLVWASGAERSQILTIKNYVDIIYPIGSILFSNDGLNPDARFPDTTWVPVGEGRLIGSVGSYTDVNGDEGELLAGNLDTGEYAHTLTEAEMPTHTHSFGYWLNSGHGGEVRDAMEDVNGTRVTTSAGGDQPHNNMPPTWAMYVWERTA